VTSSWFLIPQRKKVLCVLELVLFYSFLRKEIRVGLVAMCCHSVQFVYARMQRCEF